MWKLARNTSSLLREEEEAEDTGKGSGKVRVESHKVSEKSQLEYATKNGGHQMGEKL
jgi:hypothetical protein